MKLPEMRPLLLLLAVAVVGEILVVGVLADLSARADLRKEQKAEVSEPEGFVYDSFPPVVVNPEYRPRRFLTAELVFILDSNRTAAELEANRSRLQDAFLEILLRQTIDGLSKPGVQDHIERQLTEAGNRILHRGRIRATTLKLFLLT